METQGENIWKGEQLFARLAVHQRVKGLGRGAWWSWLMGQKQVEEGGSLLRSRKPSLRSGPWMSSPGVPLGPVACQLSQGAGPPCWPAPLGPERVNLSLVVDTRGGLAPSASWHITLGHREKRGLNTASVSSVNGSHLYLIAIGTKTGRKPFPTQNRLPGCSVAPWHLSRGPGALAGARGICAGELLAVWARPARERFYTRHVTAVNPARISSFKQHLKYSLGEAEAKYGTACECLVWTF